MTTWRLIFENFEHFKLLETVKFQDHFVYMWHFCTPYLTYFMDHFFRIVKALACSGLRFYFCFRVRLSYKHNQWCYNSSLWKC